MRYLIRFRYVVLVIALVPLACSMSLDSRTAEDGDVSPTDLVRPKVDPLLSRDSQWHWAFAAASAAVFVTAAVLLFDREDLELGRLINAGLFTATVGMLLLLGFQNVAERETHYRVTGSASAIFLHLVVVVIAYCYRLVQGSAGNALVSFIAFTLSVGFCEETTKLLPVLFRLRRRELSESDARVLGFVSGAGFGVAEGIFYSLRYYNGSAGAMTYLMRFISCVALHAFATAVAATLVVRVRLGDERFGWAYVGRLVQAILPVMMLHALYDTLVMRPDLAVWSLCPFLFLFLLLAFQIEKSRSSPSSELWSSAVQRE